MSYMNENKHNLSRKVTNNRSEVKLRYTTTDPIPFDTVGLFTFLRTYARRHDETNPNSTIETWQETLNRIIESCSTQLGVGFTEDENWELFRLMYNRKCFVAGRFMWQLGTETVNKLGLMSLQNCAHIVANSPIEPFTWTMNYLMLGAGVGYRILKQDVKDLPIVKYACVVRKDTNDADFIVPDSREGWVKLLGKVLKSHFYSGEGFTYSCILLRSKGAAIKSFGGIASGPDSLCEGMRKINIVLNNREGKKIRPIDALDIFNIIGELVVSGNVRRCLPKGALVHTNHGLIPIEEVKSGMKALTTQGYREIRNVMDQGKQKIVRIRTNNGYFECTSNHRMAVSTGNDKYEWKRAKDLVKNDKLINPKIKTESDSNPESSLNLEHTVKFLAEMHIKGRYDENGIAILETIHNYDTILEKHLDLFFIKNDMNNERKGYVQYRIDIADDLVNVIGGSFIDKVPEYILRASYLIRSQYIGVCIINGEMGREDFAKSVQSVAYSCGIQVSLYKSIISISLCDESKGDFYFSRVQDIKRVKGKRQTYDIEVSDVHEFFCDGYLTHNSAQIALGDVNDKEFLKAKDWGSGNIPNWRAYSNNSVICNDIKEILENKDFWDGYNGNGEPYGLINLNLHKKIGRLGDTKYPDSDVTGINPCSEQSLNDKETCCLSEIVLPNIESEDELKKCATYMYRICKHSLALPCKESRDTEKVVHRNMRMGIGITGYLQSTEEQKSWLSNCYTYLREFDKDYSRKNGFPVSIKLTTVKPSGTLSLLGGCTSGVHPGYSQYYIRRVRISSESPLIKLAKNHGYYTEYVKRFDGTFDHSTTIIEFPYRLPSHTIFADKCSAVQQLKYVKRLQKEWSDNAVSNTVTFKKEELPEIKEWLRENYNDSIKSVSFLLYSGHGFAQAPFEPITKERYHELISKCRKIESTEGVCYINEDEELIAEQECASGSCPIR